MNTATFRVWLLTAINLLAGLSVLFLAFDEMPATRGLIDDGVTVLATLAAFLLVPALSGVIYALGRRSPPPGGPGWRFYKRISIGFLALCWLTVAGPALFWGAIMVAAREPWPLSLAQGPDTERAKAGVETLFGAGPAQAMSSVYLFSFSLRGGAYFVRFDYSDPAVIDSIAALKNMAEVPLAARDDRRFDLRAHRDRLSWWRPDVINRADVLYVDRPTAEAIAGARDRSQPLSVSRVLWVDRAARTAYYRELEF